MPPPVLGSRLLIPLATLLEPPLPEPPLPEPALPPPPPKLPPPEPSHSSGVGLTIGQSGVISSWGQATIDITATPTALREITNYVADNGENEASATVMVE